MSADGPPLPSLSPSSLVTTVCAATCAAAAVVVAASSVVIAANSVTNAPLSPPSSLSSAKRGTTTSIGSSRSRTGTPNRAERTALAPAQLLLGYILPRFFSGWPPSRIQQQNGKNVGETKPRGLGASAEKEEQEHDVIATPGSNTVRSVSPRKPDPYDTHKRDGYLSWDDYFMSVAFLSSQRSKDPNRQVGACIVNTSNIILGIGYNGFPRGIPDDVLPWAKLSRSGSILQTKFPYVVHAEANAILNCSYNSVIPTAEELSGKSKSGQRIYVTLFPCCECAKLIVQAGISEVIYYDDKNINLDVIEPGPPSCDGDTSLHSCSSPPPRSAAPCSSTNGKTSKDTTMYIAAARILKLAGVRVRQHKPVRSITLTF